MRIHSGAAFSNWTAYANNYNNTKKSISLPSNEVNANAENLAIAEKSKHIKPQTSETTQTQDVTLPPDNAITTAVEKTKNLAELMATQPQSTNVQNNKFQHMQNMALTNEDKQNVDNQKSRQDYSLSLPSKLALDKFYPTNHQAGQFVRNILDIMS